MLPSHKSKIAFAGLLICLALGRFFPPPAQLAAQPLAPGPKLFLTTQAKKILPINLEIARTPAQLTRGLMFREHLAPTSGMLFIFPDDQVRTFWMKNTRIPLDMIFIDKGLRIVGVVEKAQPETLVPRSVPLPSRYVLEVNAGFCERHGVRPGDGVRLEGVF